MNFKLINVLNLSHRVFNSSAYYEHAKIDKLQLVESPWPDYSGTDGHCLNSIFALKLQKVVVLGDSSLLGGEAVVDH